MISPIIVAKSTPRKIRAIHDIWRSGHGVVCLQVFNNAMAVDAFTREAAIIHAIGETTNTPFENSLASQCALSFLWYRSEGKCSSFTKETVYFLPFLHWIIVFLV